jgi:hypothetical protein
MHLQPPPAKKTSDVTSTAKADNFLGHGLGMTSPQRAGHVAGKEHLPHLSGAPPVAQTLTTGSPGLPILIFGKVAAVHDLLDTEVSFP